MCGSDLKSHPLALCSKYLVSQTKPADSCNNYSPIRLETEDKSEIFGQRAERERRESSVKPGILKIRGDMAENKMYFLERQETVTDLNREARLWRGGRERSWLVSLVMHPCNTPHKNIVTASAEGDKDKSRR